MRTTIYCILFPDGFFSPAENSPKGSFLRRVYCLVLSKLPFRITWNSRCLVCTGKSSPLWAAQIFSNTISLLSRKQAFLSFLKLHALQQFVQPNCSFGWVRQPRPLQRLIKYSTTEVRTMRYSPNGGFSKTQQYDSEPNLFFFRCCHFNSFAHFYCSNVTYCVC